MKKTLKNKIASLPAQMYYTTNNPDPHNAKYKNCKYFILFHNTKNLVCATTTQNILEYHVNEILKNGYYCNNKVYYASK